MSNLAVDTLGIAEFFFTHAILEDAGNGLVRVVRCVKRRGELMPVCSTVQPALGVLGLARDGEEMALRILRECAGVGH